MQLLAFSMQRFPEPFTYLTVQRLRAAPLCVSHRDGGLAVKRNLRKSIFSEKMFIRSAKDTVDGSSI